MVSVKGLSWLSPLTRGGEASSSSPPSPCVYMVQLDTIFRLWQHVDLPEWGPAWQAPLSPPPQKKGTAKGLHRPRSNESPAEPRQQRKVPLAHR